MEQMLGRGRDAIEMIVEKDSFCENTIGDKVFDPEYGEEVIVGTGRLNGEDITVLANDSYAVNARFRVVYCGVIGMEGAYKMASAVYETVAADSQKPMEKKRPIVLIVDTPGNGPGKVEEIFGMNKATGAYQLALAEARKVGHPVIAVIIGRAISGGFLCHGLQADRILTLPKECGTMVHVMPLSSIARITKLDLQELEKLAQSNPVFAAGVDYFYRLGGVEEILESPEAMACGIISHIADVRKWKAQGRFDMVGPQSRGTLGAQRGGRTTRQDVIDKMNSAYCIWEADHLV